MEYFPGFLREILHKPEPTIMIGRRQFTQPLEETVCDYFNLLYAPVTALVTTA